MPHLDNIRLLSPALRYFDYMQGHLRQHCNYKLPAELRAELETAVINLEASCCAARHITQPV